MTGILACHTKWCSIMRDIKIVCDNCGKQFTLSSVGIKTSRMDLDEGACDVVFFNCPSCKAVYVVSVKDAKWIKLKADLDKQVERQARMHGRKDIQFAKYIGELILVKKERLGKHTEKLKQKYDGRFTLVRTESGIEDLKLLPRETWKKGKEDGCEQEQC